MRDEFDEPQPAIDAAEAGTAEAAMAHAHAEARAEAEATEATEAPVSALSAALPMVPAGIQLLNRDFLTDVANLPDGSIDLILADPPYGLGKD
jgi:site-specific DNA-methyltransferase (adenine-specific)